jgi:hypothetical protein
MPIKKLSNGSIDDDYYRNHFSELNGDIVDELNIKGNPKTDLLLSLAYKYGHSSGASEIFWYADDLVELIR